MESLNPNNWLSQLSANDKVLLVNPPVNEVRYAWIRWNQPSDLLQLSSKLKYEVGCQVELLDFMLPTDAGRVAIRDLGRTKIVGNTTYKTRTYGMPLEEARNNIRDILQRWKPTYIIITSLTSYWFETIWTLIPNLKTIMPDVPIILTGAYPAIEKNHASRSNADFAFDSSLRLHDYIPDFDLYYQEITSTLNSFKAPSFGGLKYTRQLPSENLIKQMNILKKNNIKESVIFEHDLFQEDCQIIEGLAASIEEQELDMNLHGLCGIELGSAKPGIFTKMLRSGFKSFYIEYFKSNNNELMLDHYGRAYYELRKNGSMNIPSGSLAGFIMIGTKEDDLERLFLHSFQLLELFGSIIPKPYTPDINTEEYKKIASRKLEHLSPHVFPLADMNGISREEYMEFYQHTSFLNEKRLGSSFNFFDDHYCSVALKRSLGKKGGA